MRTEPFAFLGSEGQQLSGRLDLPEAPPRTYAVFAHCFTCTKASVAATRIARALTRKGIGVLRFDFTGLGDSEGAFADSTFSGSVRDVAAAARAMTAAGRAPALLIGHSLGGAAVLAAAGGLAEVKAVTTIGAPFSPDHVRALLGDHAAELEAKGEAEVNIGGRPFHLRRAFFDDLAQHDAQAVIHDLRRALLILHSPIDKIVDVGNASQIFLAARHPKSFVSLDHADHLLTRAADADYAAELIAAWASRYLTAEEPVRSADQPGFVTVEETGAGGYQLEVRAGEATLIADEPVEAGGLGSGPTPYDLLNAALGACTAITLRMYAQRKAWPLDKVRVAVGHTRDPAQTPPEQFSRDIRVTGPLDAAQRQRLLEIAEQCPVHRTLSGGARVTTAMDDAMPPAAGPMEHSLEAEADTGGA
ncbi:MAG: alpha/beta fold hydrolase [Caulobacterales bacterium]|nr:alpha/beta fold hydrolase [Caulobacterales bacterium]